MLLYYVQWKSYWKWFIIAFSIVLLVSSHAKLLVVVQDDRHNQRRLVLWKVCMGKKEMKIYFKRKHLNSNILLCRYGWDIGMTIEIIFWNKWQNRVRYKESASTGRIESNLYVFVCVCVEVNRKIENENKKTAKSKLKYGAKRIESEKVINGNYILWQWNRCRQSWKNNRSSRRKMGMDDWNLI